MTGASCRSIGSTRTAGPARSTGFFRTTGRARAAVPGAGFVVAALLAAVIGLPTGGCSRDEAPAAPPATATPAPPPATTPAGLPAETPPPAEGAIRDPIAAPIPELAGRVPRRSPTTTKVGIPARRRFREVREPPLDGDRGPIAVYRQMKVTPLEELRKQTKYFSTPSRRTLSRVDDSQLRRILSGEPVGVERFGGRAVVTLTGSPWTRYAVFVWRRSRWRFDIMLSLKYRPWLARAEVEEARPLTIAEATEGLNDVEGPLVAEIETSNGTLYCRLFEDIVPQTVANFVGLARGLRAFEDPDSKKWVRRPFYDGTVFHRCVPGFMIQGGDPTGTGEGGPGYTIPDDLDLHLRHDRGGILSMANAGPNTAGSQFFVTETATPWLDDRHAVFGECAEPHVAAHIARLKKRPGSDRPLHDVVVRTVKIYRVEEPDKKP